MTAENTNGYLQFASVQSRCVGYGWVQSVLRTNPRQRSIIYNLNSVLPSFIFILVYSFIFSLFLFSKVNGTEGRARVDLWVMMLSVF